MLIEPKLWSVRFLVSEDEIGSLTNAYIPTADDPWGAEFGGWLEDEFDSHPYFLVYIRAPNAEAASTKASAQLARMRAFSGYEARHTNPDWVTPACGPQGLRFMAQAKELFQGENYELAVVAAQIHLEHQARLILGILGERPDAPRWAQGLASGGYGPLHKPGGLAIIDVLTGEDLSAFDAWADYKAHVHLRNRIVHEGKSATRDQALRSIKSVQAVWLVLSAALLRS